MSRGALTRRGLLLAVTGISLYLLAPALIGVFGAFDELDEINPLWFVAMVALQVGSFGCMWGILRLAVRARQWGPVILSQLAANSFARVVPGGPATVGAVQYAMLVRAGVPSAAAASGITASALVVFATLLALPLLALPAILTGVAVDPTLTKAALAGAVIFVLMVVVGAASVIWDRPLDLIGRSAQALLNRLRPNHEPLTALPERLLRERAGVPGATGVLRRAAARQPAAHPGRGRIRGGWSHGNARARGRGTGRGRGVHARLPARLFLVANPRGRRRGGDPQAPLRNGGGRAAA